MEDINSLFAYNPPSLEIFPPHTPVAPSPLTFYDKHVDKHLLLKRVVTMPSLPQDLSENVDKKMLSLEDSHFAFPLKESGDLLDQETRDIRTSIALRTRQNNQAHYLVSFYKRSTAMFCNSLASILGVLPDISSTWFTLMDWSARYEPETTAQPYITEGYALRLEYICADESKLPDGLSQSSKTCLREAFKRYPELATWQIMDLSVENEEIINAMDQIASTPSFPFQACLTTGHPSLPDIPVPPDAPDTPWAIPLLEKNHIQETDAPWRNTRSRGRATMPSTHVSALATEAPTKVIPKRPKKLTKTIKRSVLVAQQLLQHVRRLHIDSNRMC